ncbi:flagellar hook capping FlgD N-terminal domain-containing protein [Ramlibacter sp. H39-3-26]|uniref:flagellar hook capping FlgD N-terminal domain-containing protein n=1 Tax=Curvibacter soli TaxID=3031331 RepID=UPI0023D9AD0B|nr:flagellar hook capping FlgD N-terminal domain-containing protein [Ramlibacter sp. H39-3-26]MDF1484201.1 flagellar hook capping FlgD N-terminal domain-containing protein [Ramlibacter sp. H39-3-26]
METTASTASQSSQAAADASTVAANGAAGMSDMFLKLLVAQIQNQNPLEPSDPSEFVTQLNALSQTEALQKLVSQNSAVTGMLNNLQVLALGGQMGSTVSVTSSSVQLADQPVDGSVVLDSNTSELSLVLTGVDGMPRRTSLGPHAAGAAHFTIDPVALGLPAGSYGVRLETDSGKTLTAEFSGQVSGVRFAADGSPLIDVAAIGTVTSADITGFLGRAN